MRLHEALSKIFATDFVISRPYLLDKRHVYLTYEDEHLPLKQRWTFEASLQSDWHPSVTELLADDWFIMRDPSLPSK